MNNQKYQKLEKIIREACPELCLEEKQQTVKFKDDEFLSIIDVKEGKQLELHHLLRAMQSFDNKKPERHWVINRLGDFLIHRDGYPGMLVGKTYDLTLSLKEQSEDTLDFLYEIFNIE